MRFALYSLKAGERPGVLRQLAAPIAHREGRMFFPDTRLTLKLYAGSRLVPASFAQAKNPQPPRDPPHA